MKIYLICPVRNITEKQQKRIEPNIPQSGIIGQVVRYGKHSSRPEHVAKLLMFFNLRLICYT